MSESVTDHPESDDFLLSSVPPEIEDSSVSLSATADDITFQVVWDSSQIETFQDEVDNKRWRCKHCGNDWSGHNHTKALGHVKGYVKDRKPCSAVIPAKYKRAYMKIYQTP